MDSGFLANSLSPTALSFTVEGAAAPTAATEAPGAGFATFDSTFADSSLTGAFTAGEVFAAAGFFISTAVFNPAFGGALTGLVTTLTTVFSACTPDTFALAALVLAALVLAVFAAAAIFEEFFGAAVVAAAAFEGLAAAFTRDPTDFVVSLVADVLPIATRAVDVFAAEVLRADPRGEADFAVVFAFWLADCVADLAAVLVVFVTFFVCAFVDDLDLEAAALVLAVILAAFRGADLATLFCDFADAEDFVDGFKATRAAVFTRLLAALLFVAAVRDLARAAAVEAVAFDRLTAFLLDGIRATLLWRPLWRRAIPAARLIPTTPTETPVVSQATGTMDLG